MRHNLLHNIGAYKYIMASALLKLAIRSLPSLSGEGRGVLSVGSALRAYSAGSHNGVPVEVGIADAESPIPLGDRCLRSVMQVHNESGKFRVVVTKALPGDRWLQILTQAGCRVEVSKHHDTILNNATIKKLIGNKCDGVIGQLTEVRGLHERLRYGPQG